MSTTTSRRQRPADPTAPRLRSGAHRSGGSVLGALMPSVLAVAAVASMITALAVWQGEEPSRLPAAAATTSERATATRDASPPSRTPAPTVAPTQSATATTTASASKRRKVVPTDMEVVVLNQTSRGGLAGTVADRLRTAGWTVPAVGNFRGVVPATTVYFPGGAEADALAVARTLPTTPRVRPRFGNLSTTRLTVVVTDSYPS